MPNTLVSTATGLFNATTTFNICDPTAENDSEAASATPPTVAGATSDSATFVPANKAVSGIAIKLARVSTNGGTLIVSFRNNTTPGTRDFTVTINQADLPNVGTSNTPTGWIVFAPGAPVTPNGTDSYLIRITRTVDTVAIYASSGNNWARQVIYSGSGAGLSAAPAVGDKIIVCGNLTGAGTSNTITVTYNVTASTVWGASAGGNAIYIGCKGVLSQQVTAATAYVLNYLGRFLIGGGGIWQNAGGTAMPNGSSLTVTAQNVANVDCGMEWGALAVVTLTGKTLTYVSTKLAVNAPGGFTSLTTADSTGWLNGDVLALAPTNRTISESESKAMGANASGTSIGTIAALTSAHSGTNDANGDIRAEVANLTRNIKIQGLSATLGSYVNADAQATVTLRYLEFTRQGSATTSKRGIDVATTTGTFDCQYCSIHDCTVISSRGFNVSGATGSGVTISNNVTYNVYAEHIINVTTSGVHTYSGNLAIFNTAGALMSFADAGSTYTNNTCTGAQTNGFSLNETTGAIGTCSGNVGHSCATSGLVFAGLTSGTISSLVGWRNVVAGMQTIQLRGGPLVFDGLIAFGNAQENILLGQAFVGPLTFNNLTLNAGVTFTCPIGIANQPGIFILNLENSSMGATTTHSTADIQVAPGAYCEYYCSNVTMASTTEVSFQAGPTPNSRVSSQKHDGTVGLYKNWFAEGAVTIDTVAGMFDVSPSVRMAPNTTAPIKLPSATPRHGFKIPVADGTTLTLSVEVRKSVAGDGTAYGGGQPRLMVRKNVAAGIAADAVIATATNAANGAFETISGTTAAVTDDTLLEIYVDCDGTTGWVDIDTMTILSGPFAGAVIDMGYWVYGLAATAFAVGPIGRPIMVAGIGSY